MPLELSDTGLTGVVGAVGVLTGWILSGFGSSKRQGRTEERIDDLEENVGKQATELAVVKQSHDLDMDKIRQMHDLDMDKIKQMRDQDIKEIKAIFSTDTGGQKFMTFTDHEHYCLLSQKTTVQEISHLTKAIVDNTKQVTDLVTTVGDIKIAVGILQDEKNYRDSTRKRRYDDI